MRTSSESSVMMEASSSSVDAAVEVDASLEATSSSEAVAE